MGYRELITSRNDLERIAELLSHDIAGRNAAVSRYLRTITYRAKFTNGKKTEQTLCTTNINRELMRQGIYTTTDIETELLQNHKELFDARDLEKHRFHLRLKGIALPDAVSVNWVPVPMHTRVYDDELQEISREHRNVTLYRELRIQQQAVVNSSGGVAIQSIPFFEIMYQQGCSPNVLERDIHVACFNDIRKVVKLIKYLPDPTPDGRIRKSKTFTRAFEELFKITSQKPKTMEQAGIERHALYDVVVLTGTPIHEIFGHHFEEPLEYLSVGETGAFKYEQKVAFRNPCNLELSDNPELMLEGFGVLGFTHTDAYGRERKRRTHIKDGTVAGFLGSEYADAEKIKAYLGLTRSEFVGNSTQDPEGLFPQNRMTCTVLDGTPEKIDLEGKIVLVPEQGETEFASKNYVVKSYEAYVIKNGTPIRLIPLQISGGINQALVYIRLLKDYTYHTGLCSKSDPLMPDMESEVYVSQFARNQVWPDQQVYPTTIN